VWSRVAPHPGALWFVVRLLSPPLGEELCLPSTGRGIVDRAMGFWETNQHHFVNAGVSVLVLVVTWLVYWSAKHAIDRFSRRKRLAEVDPGAETRFRMIQRLLAVVLFFVAVGLVFWIMDVSALKRVAVGMFASAGVAGIAIGFAAQTTMSNLVSGVIIAFAQPIRLGDSVTIDGEYGTVETIGLFYTYIKTWDNRRLIIPNKLLSDQTIRNFTLIDTEMPAVVSLRLSYDADLDVVREYLISEAKAHPAFAGSPEPVVQMVDADELGVTVRLMAWTPSQTDAWNLAVDVRERVIRRLGEAGLSVWVNWSRVVPDSPER